MELPDLEPRIVDSTGSTLIGMHITTSLADYRAAELWRSFQPRSREIEGVGADRFHVKIFSDDYDLLSPDPHRTFTIWACAQAPNGVPVPAGMQRLTLPAGRYAVFRHVGPASAFPLTLGRIFSEWLPSSGYAATVDRPHFERMPPDYDPNAPNATEEIWIPIAPAS